MTVGITRWLHCANVVERMTVGITRWLHCNVIERMTVGITRWLQCGRKDESGDNTVASLC